MPTGLQVVQGQATAATNGGKLTITNSNGAILNWQSFSIGAGNSVRFDQPNAASQVLNRVTGNDPSNILGSLSSNGRVWLLNPNGVLFGQGARVDVAGLVTSTLNLNDSDWTAGRYLFTTPASGAAGSIINQGEIRSAAGGQVLLLAGAGGVRNEGLIDTQGGQIVLAAGASIELLDTATPRFTVKVTAPAGEVLNLGSLNAGRIDVQAATVNQQGVVRADSLGVGPGGEIVLQASERVTLADGSVTSATAANGQGGSIDVLGNEAVLLGSALVDASGASGGGAIRIGGDFHGAGTLPTAARTYVGSGVQLNADATGRGDGGSVVVWSDDNTRFLGSLSARGGAAGGNGGFAEVSGKQFLDFRGFADLGAVAGARGTLLLDPLNLTIQATGADVNGDGSNADLTFGTVAWDYAPGANSVITSGAVQSMLSTGDVVLEATNNITVNSAINAGGAAHALTMHAGNDIDVNASIGGMQALSLAANYTFTSGTNPPAPSGVGALHFGTGVQLGAGFVTLNAAGSIVLPAINASGGNVNITSTAGGISQTGAISTTVIGSSFIAGGTGSSIDLGSQANSIAGLSSGSLTFSAPQDVIIRDQGSISIPTSVSNLAGKLVLVSDTGSITQTAPFSVGADGSSFTTSTANQTITLTDAGNQLNGHTVSLNTTGTTGNASIAADAINFAVSNVGGKLTATAATGGITQSGALTIGADGSSFTTSGSSQAITLTSANVLGGHTVALNATGDASLTADTINFAASTIGGKLVASASTDGISQSGALTVGADGSSFTATGAGSPITLTDTGNKFGGHTLQFTSGRFGNVSVTGERLVLASSTIGGNLTATAINDGSTQSGTISLTSGTLIFNSGSTSSASLLADGDILLLNGGNITSGGTVLGLTLSAGANPGGGSGTTGAISISGSSISTAGGNIVMGGGGSVTTVAGGSLSNAAPGGVSIANNSTINATGSGTASVQIYGDTSTSLAGVSISGSSTVRAKQLTIAGSSSGGPGVEIEDATLNTTSAMTIQGVGGNLSGAAEGVTISGVSPITASPGVSGSGVLSISGRSTGGSTGLYISPTSGGFVTAGNGMSLSLYGEAASASDTAVLLSGSFSGSADLTVTAAGPTPTMSLSGATLSSGGTGNLLLTGASTLDLTSSQITASHMVTIQADSLTIGGGSSITANQPFGDAILIEGNNGVGIGHFVNMAGSQGLQVNGGRWIVWSADINDENNFDPQTSAYDFTRYGVTGPADWANDVGSGFVSSTQPGASLTGFAPDKTYDGTRNAPGSSFNVATGVGTATVASGATLLFDSKDAGYGSLSLNDPSLVTYLDSNDKPIYGLTLQSHIQATINPAELTITLAALDKVYDRTTTANVTASTTGLVAGEQLTITTSGTFSDKNVGIDKSVEANASVNDGTGANAGLASNYNWNIVNTSGLKASITPATLYIGGLTAQNRIYNGSTGATLTGTAQVTPITGDDVSLLGTASGSFADKNVGTGKTVSVTGLSLGGDDGGNYVLAFANPLTANITPLNLSVSGLTAIGKTYDATTVAALGGTANVTALPGDSVSVQSGYVGSFGDKNVGTGKAVTVSGLVLTGADAGNYTVSGPSGSSGGLTADITPASLLVSGLVAQNKVYDATLGATLGGTASLGSFAGDVVSLAGSGSAQFTDKNVGTGKTVSVTGLSLTGADAGNYTLVQPTGLKADITPATLQLGGLTANGKVYDATVAAGLGGTASVSGFAGDTVGLAGTASGAFADKNVGTGKAVTVSGLSLTGADAGNYTLVSQPNLAADITPATLQVGGLTANGKVYDATTVATLGGTASVSAFAGDTVGLAGTASGAFADKNVGAGKQVTVSGLSLTGADAGNYTLVAQSNLAADITPATLSYVADPVTKALNAALPALGGSVGGFLGDDTQANSTSGSLSFTTSATATSPQGSYAINGQGLAAQNYQFVQAAGNETALTVSVPTTAAPPPVVVQSTAVAIQSVAPVGLSMPTTPTSTNTSAGLVDLTSPPASSGSTASPVAASFAPVRLSALSMDALASLLAERDAYKQALLAEAAAKLEKNPGLADVHACQSLSEAAAGTCAVTDELKRKAQAEGTAQALASAPVAAPAAAPAPVAAAPAAPVVAAAPVAPVAPPPAPVQALPTRRHVKLAALPQIERKVAVVIGVDAYDDRTIPSLGNAINDAEAMGSMFEGKLGYETVVIPNATKASVIGTLNRLALAMGPKDSVTIYYAGHGELVQQTGQGYWLLSDADAKKPETWLSNADIGRLINQIGASQVALISDSCYSGSLVSDERIRPSGTPPDPAQVLQQKSVVVMSSGGNEPVSDAGKQGHSPFTFNLLNQLGQLKQWQAGGNVFERVRFAVARELPQRPQYGASAAAGHQRGGDYLFEQRQLDVGPQ